MYVVFIVNSAWNQIYDIGEGSKNEPLKWIMLGIFGSCETLDKWVGSAHVKDKLAQLILIPRKLIS